MPLNKLGAQERFDPPSPLPKHTSAPALTSLSNPAQAPSPSLPPRPPSTAAQYFPKVFEPDSVVVAALAGSKLNKFGVMKLGG